MSGDDDIDTWRRDRLGDEPIYSSVPTPANPDDIICYGSDEELDDAAKVAKRLRYEEQGLKYLRGQPLRLLSTTLRGPFDKASGWKNPWLPEPSNMIQPVRGVSCPHPMKNGPAVKRSFLRSLKLRAAAENTPTPRTDDSMQCHLPSPESNRGSEVFHEYLDSEKHGRIKAWAGGVSMGPFEKDEFWAPEKAVTDKEKEDANRKRSAGDDWLRRKPTKRNRPDTQGTRAASTPTPLPFPKMPTKIMSVSTHDTPYNKSRISQRCTSHSFELTPSSTVDQRPAEPVDIQPITNSVNNDRQSLDELTMPGDATASLSSSDVSTASKKLPVGQLVAPVTHGNPTSPSGTPSVHEQEQSKDESEQETPPETNQSEIESRRGIDGHEDIHQDTLDSFLDQSFHYRARPLRPEISTEHPSTRAKSSPPQLMQPVNSTLLDRNSIDKKSTCFAKQNSLPPIEMVLERDLTLQAMADGSLLSLNAEIEAQRNPNSDVSELTIEESNTVGDVTTSDSSKGINDPTSASDGGVPQRGEKITDLPDQMTVDETHSSGVFLKAHWPLKRDHTSTEENCTTEKPPEPLLKKICLEQLREPCGNNHDQPRDGENRSPPEPALDKGSPLVGHMMDATPLGSLMDVDGSTEFESSKQSKLSPAIDPASSDAAIASQVLYVNNGPTGSTENETLGDEPENNSGRFVVPLCQLECSILDSKEPSPSKSTYTPEVASMEMKQAPQDSKENITVGRTEPDRGCNPQSPWVPDEQLTIKQEPAEDDDKMALLASADISISPQSDQEEPTVRASQQSPWAGDAALPTIIKIEESKLRMDIEFKSDEATIHDEQQGLYEERISIITSPIDHTPTLPVPADGPCGLDPETIEIQNPRLERQSQEAVSFGPSTPAVAEARPSTPEPEISIKSFAKFNTPSPMQRPGHSKPRLSSSRRSGILVNTTATTPSNPWGSAKPSNRRRVSFAPLPGGDADDEDETNQDPLPATAAAVVVRAASPPPEATVEAGDEDVNVTFHRHFDAVKRRSSNGGAAGGRGDGGGCVPPPEFRLQQPLLPSFLQQKPASPAVGAMAEAFREADALAAMASTATAAAATTAAATGTTEQDEPMFTSNEDDTEPLVAVTDDAADAAQSPWQWQAQAQQQVDDDVAAVLGNLDQFLDTWDVDTAMKRANFEPEPGLSPGSDDQLDGSTATMATGVGMGILEVDALQGVGVWD